MRTVTTEDGPFRHVAWLPGNDRRVRAKQIAMLELDEIEARQWVETMRDLVTQNLPDREFTVKRMRLLKEREASRRSAQTKLHWRFNAKRRPDLLERDVRTELAKTAEDLAEGLAEMEKQIPTLKRARPVHAREKRAPEPRGLVRPRDLSRIDPNYLQQVQEMSGMADLSMETDKSIFTAVCKHRRMPERVAIEWLGKFFAETKPAAGEVI